MTVAPMTWSKPRGAAAQEGDARGEALARLLLDRSAPYGDRGDAAMQLEEFDGPHSRAALTEIALSDEHKRLADRAAESLSGIWCRTGRPDWDVFRQLKGAARAVAGAIIRRRRPEWATRVNDESDG